MQLYGIIYTLISLKNEREEKKRERGPRERERKRREINYICLMNR
jgi:hypothetical protein